MKNCLFGYKKVGNNLVIDEPAAETVRMIFCLAAQGKKSSTIAKTLNTEKRPTPSEHKKGIAAEAQCNWNQSAIWTILSDEQYVGTYVAGKSKSLDPGGPMVPAPESEWVKIPDHHPAIVERSVFDAVQAKRKRKSPPKNGGGRRRRYEAVMPVEPVLRPETRRAAQASSLSDGIQKLYERLILGEIDVTQYREMLVALK